MNKKARTTLSIAFTGGGTAGHRLPLIAVSQALNSLTKTKILYLGEKADCQSKEIKELPDIETVPIEAGKLRRYFSWQNFSDFLRVFRGYWQARVALKEFSPAVLFSKGGYVSVPVVRAAAALGIPIITHESDIIMGLANRLNAKRATKICTAYDKGYYRNLPSDKLIYTGNLIRAELIKAASSGRALKIIKVGGRSIFTDKPILVILGGSQGAHRINELISSLLPTLVETFRIVHQTGSGDAEWLQQKRLQLGSKEQRSYFPISFLPIDELAAVLQRAGIIVSRSGSMISELSLFAKPTILIPLSTSAGGHQQRNAKLFANKGAAVVLSERNLKPADLLKAINRLQTKPEKNEALIAGMKKLREAKGAEKVAKIILRYAKK